MDTQWQIASERLLLPTGLDVAFLQRLLAEPLAAGADFADIYLQYGESESWSLEESLVKDGSFSSSLGAGLRAVQGQQTGFSFCDGVEGRHLAAAMKAACTLMKGGGGRRSATPLTPATALPLYSSANPLAGMPADAKVALLHEADQEARRSDSRVVEVSASLAGSWNVILVAGSDGVLGWDVRPLVRLTVSVIVESSGRRERGSSSSGARSGYEVFSSGDVRAHAREAVRMALVNLEAVPAPAGEMTVVLGPGWPGVLLHEAVGHGLEGDFNRKGSSAFSGRVGTRVASPLCTVVDNGTLAGLRGSLSVDDEGTPTAETLLIEKGILRGYLQDKLNSRLMGVPLTGNGRRMDYSHLPMPRMTNTYLAAGDDDPADIIRSVDKGIYCVNFAGGQVDITSGNFVFSANEAYLIEAGQVTRPVKGATLIGNGPDTMTRVTRVGHDLALDKGIGTCGKDGQSVPVGVGQPTLRIDGVTVGGTRA